MCGFKLYLIFIPFTTDTYFYYKQYLSGLSENQTLSKHHCTHKHFSSRTMSCVVFRRLPQKKLGFFICIIILYCLNEKRFLLVFLCCVCVCVQTVDHSEKREYKRCIDFISIHLFLVIFYWIHTAIFVESVGESFKLYTLTYSKLFIARRAKYLLPD